VSQSSSAGDEAANLRDHFLIHFILLASQRGFVHTAAAARNRTAIFRARHAGSSPFFAVAQDPWWIGPVAVLGMGMARRTSSDNQKSGCIVYPATRKYSASSPRT